MDYVTTTLARLADQQALWAYDLRKLPELLEEYGLEPEDITKDIAKSADEHNARELRRLLDRYNKNRMSPPPSPVVVKQTSKKRQKVFGEFSVSSVVRWMGKEGWSLAEALSCLDSLDIRAEAENTRWNLWAGRKGTGEIAALSSKQEAILNLGRD